MDNPFFNRILELTKAKRIGTGWQGHCPAHGDKNPSLSIKQSNSGKVLVKCHSGCSQQLVIDTFKSLNAWPIETPETTNHRTEYYYEAARTDETVLRVIRIDRSNGCKSIFQQHIVGKSWVNGGYHEPLHPYHFGKWRGSKKRIYIVEGEKCVHALEALGLNATTFVGGANGWRSHYLDYFIDRDVVILPDNDTSGASYGQEIANALFLRAKSIKILPLPDLEKSEDVFDWLDRGHTTEQLESIVQHAPEFTSSRTSAEENWSEPKPLSLNGSSRS